MTLVDLAERFGDIPATRICHNPPPGQATEADLVYYQEHEDRLFELVDGTLIEKTMGSHESHVVGKIFLVIANFLEQHPLGIALPADGQLKIRCDAIRVPDVSFISKERVLNSDFGRQNIASMSPNLAVEVISTSNSRREMDSKLKEYFATGSEEVWYVYPKTHELHQFTSAETQQVWRSAATLTTRLLPGLELKLAEIFRNPLDVLK